MRLPYNFNKHVTLVNISAPLEWFKMYKESGFMLHGPYFCRAGQKKVIKERKAHGLKYGFYGLEYSYNKEAGLMISFSSSTTEVKPCMSSIMEAVMPHINAARVKLDVLELIHGCLRVCSVDNFYTLLTGAD